MARGNGLGTEKDLVLIDTNVFVIDLRYKRDPIYEKNLEFLDLVARTKTGFTTTLNLLELCGILSFNLNEKQLIELWMYFQDRYKVSVIPVDSIEAAFPTAAIKDIFDLIKQSMSFGDALMVALAKEHLAFISTLITWNKEHFKSKFPGTVLSPEEFLS
jgi:predicted nucleic acid-binding protein